MPRKGSRIPARAADAAHQRGLGLGLILVFCLGCPSDDQTLASCTGLTAENAVEYIAGWVKTDVSGDRDRAFDASGLMTVADTGGGIVRIEVWASDEPSDQPTVTTLTVDCYQPSPIEEGVGFSAPVGEFQQATTQMQCWGWYDLLAVDPMDGETAHYASSELDTGSFALDASLELPLDDGTPGHARGEFEFDATDAGGARLTLADGRFQIPVCRLD